MGPSGGNTETERYYKNEKLIMSFPTLEPLCQPCPPKILSHDPQI
jgi:hypothetical protein